MLSLGLQRNVSGNIQLLPLSKREIKYLLASASLVTTSKETELSDTTILYAFFYTSESQTSIDVTVLRALCANLPLLRLSLLRRYRFTSIRIGNCN